MFGSLALYETPLFGYIGFSYRGCEQTHFSQTSQFKVSFPSMCILQHSKKGHLGFLIKTDWV